MNREVGLEGTTIAREGTEEKGAGAGGWEWSK